ncbi:N-acetylglutamate synthase-like GNAT family acetyltransferase [Sphingomonas sp. UYAg733]
MADDIAGQDRDEMLRNMARHRGFKLVKSRRRKPGAGDFGLYGLTEAIGGKEIVGFGAKGLTATGDEIAAFLREGELSAWGASIDATPARPVARKKPEPEPDDEPEPEIRPRAVRSSKLRKPSAAPPLPPKKKPEPAPPAEPALTIRQATKDDAVAIAALLRALDGAQDEGAKTGTRIAEAQRDKAVILVADRDGVIGVVAGSVFATLQSGRIGRLSLILVAPDQRRRGVGRMLVEAAQAALAKRGCAQVEAVSDIAIRNSHAFFRKLGFEQASYRFTRAADAVG